MTKAEIAQAFKEGKISFEDMQAQIAAIDKKPFRMDVGKAGGLVLYFDGWRYPVNVALVQAEELFSDEGVARVRQFIEENRKRFKVKAD